MAKAPYRQPTAAHPQGERSSTPARPAWTGVTCASRCLRRAATRLDQRHMNWRHVGAPRAWQTFSALRPQLAEIAAATTATAYRRCPARRSGCKQTPKKAATGRQCEYEEPQRSWPSAHRTSGPLPACGVAWQHPFSAMTSHTVDLTVYPPLKAPPWEVRVRLEASQAVMPPHGANYQCVSVPDHA